MNKLVPVGSVIRTNKNDCLYVIVGNNIIYNNKKYDYMCVLYPCGYYEGCKFEYFDDADVKTICCVGDINE